MSTIKVENAYFVKLGKGGSLAALSFQDGMIRFDWNMLSPDEINQWDETNIREKIRLARQEAQLSDSKGVVSNDLGALRKIVHSTSEDLWITFDDSYLWWCRLADGSVNADKTSQYRKLSKAWSNCDASGGLLITNQLPGRLTKIQRFSGTICSLGKDETADLVRLLNCQLSQEYQAMDKAKTALVQQVALGLSLLHWKDFELLVDLIFRDAGWRRVTVVGESLKYVDMVLEEPITGDRYQVQVKSDATIADFEQYAKDFVQGDFKKLYFVVHSSRAKWAAAPSYEDVELILSERLAEMIVDAGLVNWLMTKVR